MGKESAKRLLTYVEDLLSLSPPEQFARTFRDGNKVFILQLGFNVQELSNDLWTWSWSSEGPKESWVMGGEDLASTFVRL